MSIDNEYHDRLLSSSSVCECCWDEPATQINHVYLPSPRWTKNPKKKNPHAEDRENLQIVGDICHRTRKCENYENRCEFWKLQKERGYDMDGWYAELNLIINERFE